MEMRSERSCHERKRRCFSLNNDFDKKDTFQQQEKVVDAVIIIIFKFGKKIEKKRINPPITMMISNNACFILSLLALSTTAFTIPSTTTRTTTKTTTTSRKAIALDWEQQDGGDLLMRAMDCADSDSCSLEEAEHYLESILHAESGCASGALIGSTICDDVSDAAEAVAHLRSKIGRESKRLL